MRTLAAAVLVLSLAAWPIPAGSKPADSAGDTFEEAGLGRLLHATPQAVKERLGEPDVARAEGKGGFWTYRLPRCALFLFFREGPKGLRLSGASTGPRRRGDPPLSVAECLASAAPPPEAELPRP
jgi:hypothetical protein